MKPLFSTIVALFFCYSLFSQQVKILNLDKPDVSFRGLSVVDNYVVWVSGTKGTIGVTYNAGKSFNWFPLNQYKDRDFRSIYALDHQTVIAVMVGSPGIIIKTSDGGKNWTEVYRDDAPEVFLDAVDFSTYDIRLGVVVGDPIQGKPYILKTVDSGDTWTKMYSEFIPAFEKGEAFFAASSSNVKLLDETTFLAVTGGNSSSLMYTTNPSTKLKLAKSNSETSGANGLDYSILDNFGLIVGGDFNQPEISDNNLFIFELKDMKFPVISTPLTPPNGYKSGVAILNGKKAVSCGLNGVDITTDKGLNWKTISETGYHACKKAKNGNKVYLTGPNGRIGYLLE